MVQPGLTWFKMYVAPQKTPPSIAPRIAESLPLNRRALGFESPCVSDKTSCTSCGLFIRNKQLLKRDWDYASDNSGSPKADNKPHNAFTFSIGHWNIIHPNGRFRLFCSLCPITRFSLKCFLQCLRDLRKNLFLSNLFCTFAR